MFKQPRDRGFKVYLLAFLAWWAWPLHSQAAIKTGTTIAARGTADAALVVSNLQSQLNDLSLMGPPGDMAAHLWKEYSTPRLDPSQILAGQILLSALERPQALPQLTAALSAALPPGDGPSGQTAAAALSEMVGRCAQSPHEFRILQDLIVPLRQNLSKKEVARGPSEGLDRLLNSLFDAQNTVRGTQDKAFSIDERQSADLPPEVLLFGAGSRKFTPKAVRPLSILRGKKKLAVEKKLRMTDLERGGAARILTKDELAWMEFGRASPSFTISRGMRGGTEMKAVPNFRRAAARINAWVGAGRDLELGMLAELNLILREGIHTNAFWGASGQLRVRQGQDIGPPYAHPDHMLLYLADFLTWYHANKNRMHPVQLAASAYQQLVRIHPFSDANGRTTRLIMDFILQRNGYLPAVFSRQSHWAVRESTAHVVGKVATAIRNAQRLIRSKIEVEEKLRMADLERNDGSRVLTKDELAWLHTDSHGTNSSRATAQVNAWVDADRDLGLDMLSELNLILKEGIPTNTSSRDNDRSKIRLRKMELNLMHFMNWYHANKNIMHPIHLAASAYQQLARIIPFSNANEHLCRLIMDFILQRNGYFPTVLSRSSRWTARKSTGQVADNVIAAIRDAQQLIRSKSKEIAD